MSKVAFVYGVELTQRDSRAEEIFGPTRLEYTFDLLRYYGGYLTTPDLRSSSICLSV